jgi:hypothetical protein
MKKILVSLALALAALGCAAQQSVMPFGAPTNIAVTASAQNLAVPGVAKGGAGNMELMAVCVGTVTCFYRHDGTTATTSNGYPLPAGLPTAIKVPVSVSNLSVIASGVGSTLYLYAIR